MGEPTGKRKASKGETKAREYLLSIGKMPPNTDPVEHLIDLHKDALMYKNYYNRIIAPMGAFRRWLFNV